MAKYALVMRIINLKCSFEVLAISRFCFNIVLIFFVLPCIMLPVSPSVCLSVSLSPCLSFCPSVSLSVCQTVRQSLSPSVCLTQSVSQTQSGWQSVSQYAKLSIQSVSLSFWRLPILKYLWLSICHLSTFKSDVFVAVTVVDIAIPVTANAYCNNTIGSHICTCNSGYTEANGQTFLGEQKQIITLKLKWNIYLAIWIS